MTEDPIGRVAALVGEAERRGDPEPTAMALATADGEGNPSVRVVLLKGVDERGFVFYTNLDSRKAAELAIRPRAALCLYWPVLAIQVRVEGPVEGVEEAEADAYFATRPRGSQLGAWASEQSRPIATHDDLRDRLREAEARYADTDVPRPPFWSGFRVRAERIEIWTAGADRLHHRELFVRETADAVWRGSLLAP